MACISKTEYVKTTSLEFRRGAANIEIGKSTKITEKLVMGR